MNNHLNIIRLLIPLGVLLIGCGSNNKKDCVHVNLDEVKVEVVNYSDLFDSITYIQLDTPGEKPLADIQTLKFIDSLLIVFDDTAQRVMMFENNGKYIKDIGSRGSGHGEFIKCRQIDVDQEERIIMIYDIAKSGALRFDFEGNYLGLDSIGRADDIAYIGNRNYLIANYNESDKDLSGIFYVSASPFKQTKLRSCRDDLALNKPFEFFDRVGHKSIMTRSYEDVVLLWDNGVLGTTVNFDIEPSPSGRQIKELAQDPFKRDEYLDRIYFFDYDELIIVLFRYKKENRYLLYDKKNREAILTRDLNNDIDGVYGIRLPISYNNSVVTFVDNNDSLPPKIQFLHLKPFGRSLLWKKYS